MEIEYIESDICVCADIGFFFGLGLHFMKYLLLVFRQTKCAFSQNSYWFGSVWETSILRIRN